MPRSKRHYQQARDYAARHGIKGMRDSDGVSDKLHQRYGREGLDLPKILCAAVLLAVVLGMCAPVPDKSNQVQPTNQPSSQW